MFLKVFVEMWLHHYSLEMYQKLQSPQVKVRTRYRPLNLHTPFFHCARLAGWTPPPSNASPLHCIGTAARHPPWFMRFLSLCEWHTCALFTDISYIFVSIFRWEGFLFIITVIPTDLMSCIFGIIHGTLLFFFFYFYEYTSI